MGTITMAIKTAGKLEKDPEFKWQGPGRRLAIVNCTFAGTYATGGDTWDLSKHFSAVEEVLLGPAEGNNLEFVNNADPSLCKIKAYASSGPLHSHNLPITGGQAETDQIPVAYDTVADRLEKAKEGMYSNDPAGPASYATGGFTLNLSGTFNAIPEVVVTCEDPRYQAVYVPGTDASDGKVKVFDINRRGFAGTTAGPNPYPAGGFTLNLSGHGVSGVPDAVFVSPTSRQDQVANYKPGTNETDGKVAITVASTGAEDGGSNLSGVTYQYAGFYGDAEVPNATNLSGVNFQVIAKGPLNNAGDVDVATYNNTEATSTNEIDNGTNLTAISFTAMVVGTPKVIGG